MLPLMYVGFQCDISNSFIDIDFLFWLLRANAAIFIVLLEFAEYHACFWSLSFVIDRNKIKMIFKVLILFQVTAH